MDYHQAEMQILRRIFAENGNLTEIGASAFTTLPLAVLKFPASLQTIGESAFYQNQSLTSVEFAADGADLTIGDSKV